MSTCPFCEISAGNQAASIIHEDDLVVAVVPLHSTYPESAVIFPKKHIDHFTDLPKSLALHIMDIGYQIGNKIMDVYNPERIGMVVHGYGVAHAHLNVLPQNHPHDITSRKFTYLKNGQIQFGVDHIEIPSKIDMDKIAQSLKLNNQ